MKPFMYAIADKYGKPMFEEHCVAEHPSLLGECIDEDDGDKIVSLYSELQIESMAEELLKHFVHLQCQSAYSASYNAWNLKCMRGALLSALVPSNTLVQMQAAEQDLLGHGT